MRQLIAQSENRIDNDQLFTMHLSFEAALEGQGGWSTMLLAFAVINALSWTVSVFNLCSSWPFQTTLPSALLILGGGSGQLPFHRPGPSQQPEYGPKERADRLPKP